VAAEGEVRPAGAEARVTLIGKPGCHLCETARDVVSAVAAELGVTWREVSVLDDPELAERYSERIPVVLVDGRPHDYWRVDERRLRQALGRRRWWRRG
jgi:glutaredoxin